MKQTLHEKYLISLVQILKDGNKYYFLGILTRGAILCNIFKQVIVLISPIPDVFCVEKGDRAWKCTEKQIAERG